jgi:hypothetical protein
MKGRLKTTVPAREVGWGENKRTQPAVQIDIELDIDMDRIARYFAEKLARASGKRSKAMGGMVVAKVVSRNQVAA